MPRGSKSSLPANVTSASQETPLCADIEGCQSASLGESLDHLSECQVRTKITSAHLRQHGDARAAATMDQVPPPALSAA